MHCDALGHHSTHTGEPLDVQGGYSYPFPPGTPILDLTSFHKTQDDSAWLSQEEVAAGAQVSDSGKVGDHWPTLKSSSSPEFQTGPT